MEEYFNVRLAVCSDEPVCADIHIRSWSFTYRGIVPDEVIEKNNAKRSELWNKLLANNIDSHYVIVSDNRTIGFLTINKPFEKDLPEDTFMLTRLYLDPDYIGKGFGKAAMDWVKKEVFARGYGAVSLWVLAENFRAKKFYEKNGFVPDGNVKNSGLGDTKVERYIYRFE